MNNLTELLEGYETSDILNVLRERHQNADRKDSKNNRLFVALDMALEASQNYDIAKNNKELTNKAFHGWFGDTMEMLDDLTIRKN